MYTIEPNALFFIVGQIEYFILYFYLFIDKFKTRLFHLRLHEYKRISLVFLFEKGWPSCTCIFFYNNYFSSRMSTVQKLVLQFHLSLLIIK